ncbi:MAG: beta-galactosidase [Rhizobiales bacterium]|nr:beta-galactosidase [Hyphomicrobiales bacterium]NRB14531.1 beta-galactosidase [Hyphomicrobiales bacterium]
MKPELGVCYYPEHWPQDVWAEDAKRMVETGLTWVRIGEFAWGKLEAKQGVYTWEWLDKAVKILGDAGLKVVMGTPSATPPKWVVNKYPDMLAVDEDGRERKFGSRRHYCFSHLGFRAEAARMAGDMAKRYGKNPYVQVWQIDNEYACHDTTLSYSAAARLGFQDWLAQKYQSPAALNRAWGNVFWSMDCDDFAEIDLPNLTVTEPNPAHVLDFKNYSSDQVVAFNAAQVSAMRRYTDRDFVHNYMGIETSFDHFKVGEDLEIASWDSYPLGFLERFETNEGDDFKAKYAQQGNPDFQAFHHDLYRAVGRGRCWVMEQQPGPVNWGLYNPIPLDGMVKLWSMEAIAHGAEVVSYFRWRQAPFAQEQMHAGLLRFDRVNAQAQIEAKQLADELKNLGDISHKTAQVAIVFDYKSAWAWDIQPQGASFDYFKLVFEQYCALRKLGLSVDFIPANATDFGNRKLVLIPALMTWSEQLNKAIADFDGVVIAGPRTGSKNADMQINQPLGPNFAGAKVSRVSSLRPNVKLPLKSAGNAINWFEEIELSQGAEAVEFTQDGAPILTKTDQHYYLTAWLDVEAYANIFEILAKQAGLKTSLMPEGVRLRDMGTKQLLVNYNNCEAKFGDIHLAAASYKILEGLN